MKKIFRLILISFVALSLFLPFAGCSKEEDKKEETTATTTNSTQKTGKVVLSGSVNQK